MKRVRKTSVVGVWFALVLMGTATLAACAQGEGQTCQVNRDCGSGLICCRAQSASVPRGACHLPDSDDCKDIVNPADAGSKSQEDSGAEPVDANMSRPDAG